MELGTYDPWSSGWDGVPKESTSYGTSHDFSHDFSNIEKRNDGYVAGYRAHDFQGMLDRQEELDKRRVIWIAGLLGQERAAIDACDREKAPWFRDGC